MTVFTATVLLTCFMISSAVGECPEIVPRDDWGAREAVSSERMTLPLTHVFIHHTAGVRCETADTCEETVRDIQNYYMDTKEWDDIGYSFLVGGDGRIYKGRGWKLVGLHTTNYNSKSIGIAFMGKFEKKPPSKAMLNAAKKLIECGVEKGYLSDSYQLRSHRDAKCTACPGDELHRKIQAWPRFKEGRMKGYTC